MDDKPVMLIVDDVEINRVVLTQFFQEEYQIMEAENGQEAMEIIEGQSVNIVLVDLVMPVMDGFQVLAMMKRNDQLAGIPVVVMTANNDGDSEARAMEMGAAAIMANTALATAGNLPLMAAAFKDAIAAGRKAYLAGLGRVLPRGAAASDPLTGFLHD